MFTPSTNSAPGGGAIMTKIGTRADIDRVLGMLRDGGFRILKSPEHIQAFDGEDPVYRALKKNRTTWIVWYSEKYFS
jgi:hypothetical protein